jgi:hypothetical protein
MTDRNFPQLVRVKKMPTRVQNSDLRRMLSAIFTLFLLNRDASKSELESLIHVAQADALKRLRKLKPRRKYSMDLVVLGSVLHRWNRTPAYLDGEAKPFPIPVEGRSPSVEALFRKERMTGYFKMGIEQMRSAGLVHRTRAGLYVPRNDTLLLHTLTPEMVANVALTMNRLISTLLENTTMRGRSAIRLIERTALVSDLPETLAREFRGFARDQGASLISTMNDWLESRRVNRPSQSRSRRARAVAAGIHVFAFCDARPRQ